MLEEASPRDRAWAAALARDNMAATYRRHGLAWEPARFAADWAAGENYLLRCDGEAVGYLRLFRHAGRSYLQDLQVEAGRRGLGLGTQALEQAKAWSAGGATRPCASRSSPTVQPCACIAATASSSACTSRR